MKRRSDLAFGLAFAAAMLAPAAAQAYCRTANCPSVKGAWQVCIPANDDDCGTVLWWGNQCVGYTLQKDASSQVNLADAEKVFKAAFATWTNADCGGGHPSVTVNYQGTVDCHVQEYNKDKDIGNANVFMFRDDTWPYSGTANILALTTVTYNLDTSEIYDADMEINSADIHSFTVSDSNVQYDLLSVATHEAGHFLGLAHSHETDATMFTDYKQGTVSLRDLTPDDTDAICATYPPGKPISAECDDTPRHGFSAECGADQTPGGCSMPGSLPVHGGAAAGIAALAAISMKRRRRR